MKLYKVTYTVETVVYACDGSKAEEIALNARSDAAEVVDAEIEATELRDAADLPPYWNRHCRPWGRSTKTIAEILNGTRREGL